MFEATAGRMAYQGLARAVTELEKKGHRVVGVGILESSGRKREAARGDACVPCPHSHGDGDHFVCGARGCSGVLSLWAL